MRRLLIFLVSVSVSIAVVPLSGARSNDGGEPQTGPTHHGIYPPELPPGFIRERTDFPGVIRTDKCTLPAGIVEVTDGQTQAAGQRVFDAPSLRVYIRGDGTCVTLFLSEGQVPPDIAPARIAVPSSEEGHGEH